MGREEGATGVGPLAWTGPETVPPIVDSLRVTCLIRADEYLLLTLGRL
jgi:hypothetical protein